MTVRKKPAIPPYEAFGDELSPAVSFLQAAAVLDISVEMAVESRDTETLTTLAALWMQLGDRLMGGGPPSPEGEEENGVELESEPRQPVGFAGGNTIKEIETEDE